MREQRQDGGALRWSTREERLSAASGRGADLCCDACTEVYANAVRPEQLEEVLEQTAGLCGDCAPCHWLTDSAATAPAEVALRRDADGAWLASVVYEDGRKGSLPASRSFGAALGGVQMWTEGDLECELEPEGLSL